MKFLYTFCLLFLCASYLCAEDWRLVWSDEFDYEGLPNPEKWNYEEGFIRNNEQQYYTRERLENARVEDGVLVIEARREAFENPKYKPGSNNWREKREEAEYTSACLITDGIASWTYGRIEVNAKLPEGRGVWPAIWMLGTNRTEVGWPECGEIDIMEFVGYKPTTIHANVHTKAYNHVKKTGKGDQIQLKAPHADFHVYAIEWTPGKIDFYLDDTKYFTFEKEEGGGVDVWPFDAPQYLLLNLAIGGSWGGQKGIDESIFPQTFEIDYVRVYEQVDRLKTEEK